MLLENLLETLSTEQNINGILQAAADTKGEKPCSLTNAVTTLEGNCFDTITNEQIDNIVNSIADTPQFQCLIMALINDMGSSPNEIKENAKNMLDRMNAATTLQGIEPRALNISPGTVDALIPAIKAIITELSDHE